MSTQSGITASKELEQKFKTLQDTNGRALVVEIDKETCVPGTLIPTAGDLAQDFSTVQQHLKDNEARYIILREGEDTFAFISFVPDRAPVRSKMLYASSAHAVHRQLGGTELFSGIIFWSEIDEVSHQGWLAHKKHESSEPPQTAEEAALRDVREKETQEMSRRQHSYYEQQPGTRAKNSSGGSGGGGGGGGPGGISLKMDQGALEALEKLKDSSAPGTVGLAIDLTSEKVVVRSSHQSWNQLSDLYNVIPESDPQYTLIKHIPEGSNNHDYIFVYTCPTKSKIKERMVYASNRSSSIQIIKNTVQIPLTDVLEATDSSDLHSIIEPIVNKKPQEETHAASSSASARKFSRPKPPGRR